MSPTPSDSGAPGDDAALGDDPALEAVAAARRAAADRLVTPWWYHPILGGLFGMLIVAVALGNSAVVIVGIVVYFAGLGLLIAAYRRQTGLWLSGFDNSAASIWAAAMGLVGAAGMVAAILLSGAGVADAVVWVIAIVVTVVFVPLGRTYDKVLRADLRGEL